MFQSIILLSILKIYHLNTPARVCAGWLTKVDRVGLDSGGSSIFEWSVFFFGTAINAQIELALRVGPL